MKILALIPARAGSKKIKHKNRKQLLGLPLIVWTIRTAKKIKELSDIYVSTNDERIIKICKNLKVKVPWVRPESLSTDGTSSVEVVLHFLNWYEKKFSKVDGLLLLQPTSPFRKKSSIEKAIKLFKKYPNKSVVSFSPLNKKESDFLFNINKKNNRVVKTLNIVNQVKLNGSIFLVSPDNIRKYKSFFKPSVLPLVQNNIEESIDLDMPDDWKFAEILKR